MRLSGGRELGDALRTAVGFGSGGGRGSGGVTSSALVKIFDAMVGATDEQTDGSVYYQQAPNN